MDQKTETKKIIQEIRCILNDWDFLGTGTNVLNDEYDCMTGPLTNLILQNASELEIEEYIKKELKEHFGVVTLEQPDTLLLIVQKLKKLSEKLQ